VVTLDATEVFSVVGCRAVVIEDTTATVEVGDDVKMVDDGRM